MKSTQKTEKVMKSCRTSLATKEMSVTVLQFIKFMIPIIDKNSRKVSYAIGKVNSAGFLESNTAMGVKKENVKI
jgi:hypothetical protein